MTDKVLFAVCEDGGSPWHAFDTEERAQSWIDAQPAEEQWYFHITEITYGNV